MTKTFYIMNDDVIYNWVTEGFPALYLITTPHSVFSLINAHEIKLWKRLERQMECQLTYNSEISGRLIFLVQICFIISQFKKETRFRTNSDFISKNILLPMVKSPNHKKLEKRFRLQCRFR